MWKSGSRNSISNDEINKKIKSHIDNKGKVVIGTDSMLTNNRFIFVNCICLIGNTSNEHGKFFYKRYYNKDDQNRNLLVRLMNETTDSLQIANDIKENFPNAKIEIHLDVNSNSKYLSHKYSSSVIGYIKGCGYDYKIKPESYAASCVADRFTRPTSSYIKKFYKWATQKVNFLS